MKFLHWEAVEQPCRRSTSVWVVGSNWRGLVLKLLTTAIAVTFYIPVVLTLLSPMREWADWQIGDNGISMQVHVSAESDSSMSSACRANTLERCVVMRSEVVLPQVTAPPCFAFLFWSRLDSSLLWLVVHLFVTFISYCMIWRKKEKKVSWRDFMLSIFVIFKLHGGWLPFMLVPCCFGDVTTITCLWHTHRSWEKSFCF